MTRVQVDLSMKEVFDLMYAGSRYLIKFLEDRKTTDIIIGGMTTMDSGLRGRTSSFTVPVGPGAVAKMTQVTHEPHPLLLFPEKQEGMFLIKLRGREKKIQKAKFSESKKKVLRNQILRKPREAKSSL